MKIMDFSLNYKQKGEQAMEKFNDTQRASEAQNEPGQLRNVRGNNSLRALLREFAPLVHRVARKYEGRGAEREDLVQEGSLELIAIARRCTRKQMASVLSRRLPGVVRAAANRMRRPKGSRSIDAKDESAPGGIPIPDRRAARDFEEIEIADLLERLLDEADRAVAKAAMDGMTQMEIAAALGLTQQAVSKKLKKIRETLMKGA